MNRKCPLETGMSLISILSYTLEEFIKVRAKVGPNYMRTTPIGVSTLVASRADQTSGGKARLSSLDL